MCLSKRYRISFLWIKISFVVFFHLDMQLEFVQELRLMVLRMIYIFGYDFWNYGF